MERMKLHGNKQNSKGDPAAKCIAQILLGISAEINMVNPEAMELADLHCLMDRIDRELTQARQHLANSPDY